MFDCHLVGSLGEIIFIFKFIHLIQQVIIIHRIVIFFSGKILIDFERK